MDPHKFLKNGKVNISTTTYAIVKARKVDLRAFANIVDNQETTVVIDQTLIDLDEAIEIEKAGLKVALKKTNEFAIAEEFQHKLDGMPELKIAFDSLTPGRQRAYMLYFSAAKQPKTRSERVEKQIPQILAGKGLND